MNIIDGSYIHISIKSNRMISFPCMSDLVRILNFPPIPKMENVVFVGMGPIGFHFEGSEVESSFELLKNSTGILTVFFNTSKAN